ncbi:hypothetical protein MXF29_04200 [Pseudomonas sp. NC26]|uniref:Uncharacterized protein n=2 Tax=Pseudomonas TaxID=286 RepID=A0A7W2L0Q4_PSEPU|nr:MULTISPECIES: hypothetical protein [Pseudomonas]MBA6116374.1 hypothetical protein [Pseudomonas putida]MCZ9639256.1 hypothetical protein [Pseudomonas putida]MEC4874800.1 hypothetical protein [Pseudomonas sp. NC26]QNL87440.1 Uncharacterized protein PPKH_2026 [Pseudomonas putida]
MSWDKVGKLLVALLLGMMLMLLAYVVLKDNARLEASLTYAYLTYPSQFSERISKASEQLKYERLQPRINSISQGVLNQEQVDRLIDLAQAPYAQLFAKPFEAGLVDHRTGLLIDLRNTGDTEVREVRIRLPAKGLVQVRDAAGNDTLYEASTPAVEIPAIEQGGECKVWVYFDADYSQIRQGGISISHADGVADVRVYREFAGFPAWVARYSRELMIVLCGLLLSVLGLGYACLGRRRASALPE